MKSSRIHVLTNGTTDFPRGFFLSFYFFLLCRLEILLSLFRSFGKDIFVLSVFEINFLFVCKARSIRLCRKQKKKQKSVNTSKVRSKIFFLMMRLIFLFFIFFWVNFAFAQMGLSCIPCGFQKCCLQDYICVTPEHKEQGICQHVFRVF